MDNGEYAPVQPLGNLGASPLPVRRERRESRYERTESNGVVSRARSRVESSEVAAESTRNRSSVNSAGEQRSENLELARSEVNSRGAPRGA